MILITGGNGFLGKAIVESVSGNNQDHRSIVRQPVNDKDFVIDSIGPQTNWKPALQDVETVIHTAAQTASKLVSYSEIHNVNTAGTLNLARQAAEAGVKRFVFISSIKVNGEFTADRERFGVNDPPNPADNYALTKFQAEKGLRDLARTSNMDVVILRPPLIYGPGVKGNILSILRWIDRGLPLPFGVIQNKRSLINLDNLVNLILVCIQYPKTINQTYIVGDDEEVSTTELIQKIGMAMNKPVRFIPIPAGLLTFSLSVVGKVDLAHRLFGNLQVDCSAVLSELGWQPPHSLDEGIVKTVMEYKKQFPDK